LVAANWSRTTSTFSWDIVLRRQPETNVSAGVAS